LTPLLSALVLSVALRGCIAGFVTGLFTRLVFGACAPTVGALLVWPLVLLLLTGLTLSRLRLAWFFLALLWIALRLVLFALAGLLVRLLALFTHRVSPSDAHQRVSMPLDAEAIRMPAPRLEAATRDRGQRAHGKFSWTNEMGRSHRSRRKQR